MPSPLLSIGAGAGKGLMQSLEEQRAEEMMRMRAQAFQETVRSNQADEAYRNRALDENVSARRDIAQENNQGRENQRTLTSIALRPIGGNVSPEEMQREQQAGAPGAMYEQGPGDAPTMENYGPQLPTIKFKGTSAQQTAATAAKTKSEEFAQTQSGREEDRAARERMAADAQRGREEQGNANRDLRERMGEQSNALRGEIASTNAELGRTRNDIAQQNADRPRSSGATRTVKAMKDGQAVDRVIDGQGNIIYEGPSQLTGSQREKQANDATDLELMHQIDTIGEQTKWGGTGMVTAPVAGLIKRATGYGDDNKEMLRTLLSTLKTQIAHEKFGSAFTNTERAMLTNFAPDANMDSSAIKTRIKALKFAYETRMHQRQSGQPDTPVTQLLGVGPSAEASPGTGGGGSFRVVGSRPAGR